jgi:MFS family permease
MTEIGRDAGRQSVRSLLKNRDFLLSAQCKGLMVTARQMLSVAVGWDVYARTGDVVDLGLIGLFLALPVILLAIPAGLVADRIDRRLILFVALVTQFASAAGIGFWFFVGEVGIAPVLLILLVSGAAHAFVNPALNSILPRLVPRNVFSNAVAATSSVTKIAQLAGPIAAGLLIAAGGQVVYSVTALIFLLAAVSAGLIRADLRISEREPLRFGLLFDGLHHILRTPKVFAAMTMDLIAVLFGGIMGILPVFASDILHVGSEGLGMMRAAPAVGAFVIGMALASHRLPWAVGRAFFVSLTVFGLSILLFAISRNYWLSLFALAVYGAADMVSVYVRQTLIQLDTPDDLRGRVSAVNAISAGGSTQLGDFRAGLMAGAIGTPASVAVGGLITLAAAALWSRRFPELARMLDF